VKSALRFDQVLQPLLLGGVGHLELQRDRALDTLLVGVEVQISGLARGGEELISGLIGAFRTADSIDGVLFLVWVVAMFGSWFLWKLATG